MSPRVVVCWLLLVFAGRASGSEDSWRHSFEAANRAFNSAQDPAEYRDVAARFEALRASGAECAPVLFNLGNAWFRAGEYGRAIAAFRQAQRYEPRDPMLAANLAEARAAAGLAAPEPELADRLLFWRGKIAYHEAADAALVLALLAFVLAVAARFGVRGLLIPSRAAAVLAAIAVGVFVTEFRRHEIERRAIVCVKDVTARKGNSETYGPAFTAPLREGEEVRVIAIRGGWAHVTLRSGIDGWVPEQALAPV
jgi:Tetratricopeptide repeat